MDTNQHSMAFSHLSRNLNRIMSVTYSLLSKQDATTSSAIISHFKESSSFLKLSSSEGSAILQRDEEDGTKLQAGIDLAKSKGVIDPNFVPEPYLDIDVLGKTPEEVAAQIIETIEKDENGTSAKKGKVIVLCGLSGTGKGTTVSKLREFLSNGDTNRQVVSWSNGNIFRSVTLLAVAWAKQNQSEAETLDVTKALTKENVASFMSMLSFQKVNGVWDTKIEGLGFDTTISSIQNTILKGPDVSKNIPTVAQDTQGEVILFASEAIEQMVSADDEEIVVLLEGRQQTVDYVRTPFRFVLTLSDSSLIGKRRAAQRVMAAALEKAQEGDSEDKIGSILEEELEKMI